MFKRNRIKPDIPKKIYDRVQRFSRQDRTDWLDQALYSVSRYTTAYKKSGDSIDLQEAYLGAQVVYAIMEIMVQEANSGR
jgi:hypothetical protein